MKLLLLLLLSLSGNNALAAGLEVRASEAILYKTDALVDKGTSEERILIGPWFESNFAAFNFSDSEVHIMRVRYQVEVISPSESTFITVDFPVDIKLSEDRGGTFISTPFYIDNLPRGIRYKYYINITYFDMKLNEWQTRISPTIDIRD